jgi:acyl dehydratase
MNYFGNMTIGDRIGLGNHTFTADEIKSFARRCDPQMFHLDEDAAKAVAFRRAVRLRLAYRGRLYGLLVDHRRPVAEAQRRRGEPVAHYGISPGARDIR